MTRKINLPKNMAIKNTMRNPFHNHPLLRKGGRHIKTNKALRQKDKVKMKKEWLPQNIFSTVCFGEAYLFMPYV